MSYLLIILIAFIVTCFFIFKKWEDGDGVHFVITAIVAVLAGMVCGVISSRRQSKHYEFETISCELLSAESLDATANNGTAWLVTIDNQKHPDLSARRVFGSDELKFVPIAKETPARYELVLQKFPAYDDPWSLWSFSEKPSVVVSRTLYIHNLNTK